MAKLVWDATGERTFELGVDHGVLYRHTKTKSDDGKVTITKYNRAYVWNGLTSIDEGVDGGEANPQYADNIKYLNLMGSEDFTPTINALSYPPEFAECDGSKEVVPGVFIAAQEREEFGFSYRTKLGNDVDGQDFGYRIHLVYGCKAEPSERTYETVNESPEAMEFSWDVSTTAVPVEGARPTAHLYFDSNRVSTEFMAKLEELLYGTEETSGRLPMPDEIVKMYETLQKTA